MASQADLLTLGWSMLDKPYVKGTSSWSSADCSGLLRLLYDAVGVRFATPDGKLPHRAGMQMNYGTAINDISQAKVGDAVFFGGGWNPYPPNGVGHVGIYIGNGMLLEAASSKTGIVVRAIGDRQILGIRTYTTGPGVVAGLAYNPSVVIPPPPDHPDLAIPGGTGSAAEIASALANQLGSAEAAVQDVHTAPTRPGAPEPGALKGPGAGTGVGTSADRGAKERQRKERLSAQLALVGARNAKTSFGTGPRPGSGEKGQVATGPAPVMPAASTPEPRPAATRKPAGQAVAV